MLAAQAEDCPGVVGTGVVGTREVVVGTGVVGTGVVGTGVVCTGVVCTGVVGTGVVGATAPMLHVPVKPLIFTLESDVKVTLRKPAVDMWTLPVLTSPD